MKKQTFSELVMTAFEASSYAARDFDIIADGKVVHSVKGAQYKTQDLSVKFKPVTAKTLQIKITGYYGKSPAIRELKIYESISISLNLKFLLMFSQHLIPINSR